MASEVAFAGSSAETIELAKAFWKSIEPPPTPKSTLFVSGLNHRLPTAPALQNENNLTVNNAARTELKLTAEETNPRLQKHLENAQKRREREEVDYVQKMKLFREEAQQTLNQRRVERLKKEEISHHRHRDPILDMSESSEEDDETAEAMAELDRFEENLKRREAINS